MKNQIKNLLSRKVFDRIVLNQIFSKKVVRFPKRLSRLTAIFILVIFLSGYHPAFTFPPVKLSHVLAEDLQQQTDEIQSQSFPKPPILPHLGYLSTRFSFYHPGIDIATDLATEIHPINPGYVLEAGFDFFGLGNYVVISHANGFKSKYAHMGIVYIKKGAEVSEETTLGEVGLTGHTSGPHTHLEVTHNDQYIDPLTILPKLESIPNLANIKKK